jgi:formylmethanofuran dehydrogenase subunit A
MHLGHAAKTCIKDKQHGHAVWTCSMDIEPGMQFDMHHEHATRTCSMDIEYGMQFVLNARTISMEKQHGYVRHSMGLQHGHAIWTCSTDGQEAWTWGIGMPQRHAA